MSFGLRLTPIYLITAAQQGDKENRQTQRRVIIGKAGRSVEFNFVCVVVLATAVVTFKCHCIEVVPARIIIAMATTSLVVGAVVMLLSASNRLGATTRQNSYIARHHSREIQKQAETCRNYFEYFVCHNYSTRPLCCIFSTQAWASAAATASSTS